MSASWGAVRAIWKQHRSLTVVHCSAHANLLPSPELIQTDQNGSYSPTGWVERLYQNQLDIVHMGLRSVSSQGWQWLQDHKSPVFWAQQDWQAADVVAKLSPHPVFLVIDSSVLDPALVSAVPHPEPGGLDWNRLLQTCQSLFAARPVVGLAVGGLTVVAGVKQSARPVARLLNWILACHGLYPQGSPSAMVGAVQESRF
jgi:agmatinase